MKKHIRAFVSLLCAAALALGCASCGGAAQSTGKSGGTAGVTHITVWTYYNGDQLESFNKLVDQFNETTGREKGIRVKSASQGSVSDLETNVMDAAQGKVGAAAMPNIFSAYADTAYALDQMGMLVDLSQYLTEDERAQYVQDYLDEGDFDGDGSMKIFPVAKSTELMFLNETDWAKFAQATGAAYDDLSTVEGLVATAGAYYDWTDAQTPEPDDGKALFGRDAMANYMLVGARQLGDTLFEVQDGKMTLNFDKDVARKLWDNYYVPFVKGWFAATGRFRSDDIKVGNVLAYVGSNSSATFFPAQVMVNDTESYDIDMTVLPSPKFAGGEDVAVQQGAGMVVTAGTEEEINASVEFLKWFTQPENNISFSVDSGYLPVTTAANDMEAIKTSGLELSPKMESILSNAVQSVKNNTLYTPSAFAGGNKARKVLEYSPSDGYRSLREKLVTYYEQYQIKLSPEEIIVTTGGSEAVLFAFMSCLNPGDEIIVPEPAYANYMAFAISAGAVIRPVVSSIEQGFALPDVAEFEKLINDRTRGILICNPNNPTGYLYTRKEMNRIRDLVKKYDLFLFSDEVYREFIYTGSPYISACHLEGIEQNVVLIDSVSKRYSECGIRIGALITKNRTLRNAVMKFCQARLSPPLIGQIVAEASIDAPRSYSTEVYEEYIERRKCLIDGLNRLPGVYSPIPMGAFYTVARLPVEDSDDFCAWCLSDFDYEGETVMLAPASGFYSDPACGRNEVRIAYVLKKEDLERALVVLGKALEAYNNRK